MNDVRPKPPKRLVVVLSGSLAMILLGGTAVAKSSAFSLTMNWRYVNGKTNDIRHSLGTGNLRLSVEIWNYEKLADTHSPPQQVTLEVWRSGLLFDRQKICTLTVTPESTIDLKKTYSASCGHIDANTYWIEAWKRFQDGWHTKATGALTTEAG